GGHAAHVHRRRSRGERRHDQRVCGGDHSVQHPAHDDPAPAGRDLPAGAVGALMPEYSERLLVLIVGTVQDLANLQAGRVAPGGEHTFEVGVSPTGTAPITHYWCSWQMTAEPSACFVNYLEALANTGSAWI